MNPFHANLTFISLACVKHKRPLTFLREITSKINEGSDIAK